VSFWFQAKVGTGTQVERLIARLEMNIGSGFDNDATFKGSGAPERGSVHPGQPEQPQNATFQQATHVPQEMDTPPSPPRGKGAGE
jgi:hypothetical protein